MPDVDLDALDELLADATPGPWERCDGGDACGDGIYGDERCGAHGRRNPLLSMFWKHGGDEVWPPADAPDPYRNPNFTDPELIVALRNTAGDLLAELRRLRAENEHLAGALERATIGQQDPVALRLGTRPVDTGPQPAPDLPEMRRLMDARRATGCVAASVWLHDLQWILDRLAQLSADAHPATHLDSEELDHG